MSSHEASEDMVSVVYDEASGLTLVCAEHGEFMEYLSDDVGIAKSASLADISDDSAAHMRESHAL